MEAEAATSCPPARGMLMAQGRTFTFDDPDRYAAGFRDASVKLTITGAGDFSAKLTQLKLQHLEVRWCHESLPRIAHISLSLKRLFLSFPVGRMSPILDGSPLGNRDIVFHGLGESMHQRFARECEWGLISVSPQHLSGCSEALNGWPIPSPHASRILHLPRAEVTRFQRIFKQARQMADARTRLIERSEVARALEQEMFHTIVHLLNADGPNDHSRKRHNHAAIMARFEEALPRCLDRKIRLPALCSEVGVPERTLRMCCADFLGVSPTRYLLLQRLNKVRSALQRADASTTSVTEIAQKHQFVELGRFAVNYRTTFGETPSTTLEREPLPSAKSAEGA